MMCKKCRISSNSTPTISIKLGILKKFAKNEFSAESKLRIIENYAFACTPNKSFIFPSILKNKKKFSFKLNR